MMNCKQRLCGEETIEKMVGRGKYGSLCARLMSIGGYARGKGNNWLAINGHLSPVGVQSVDYSMRWWMAKTQDNTLSATLAKLTICRLDTSTQAINMYASPRKTGNSTSKLLSQENDSRQAFKSIHTNLFTCVVSAHAFPSNAATVITHCTLTQQKPIFSQTNYQPSTAPTSISFIYFSIPCTPTYMSTAQLQSTAQTIPYVHTFLTIPLLCSGEFLTLNMSVFFVQRNNRFQNYEGRPF